jgi:hypothetical protein
MKMSAILVAIVVSAAAITALPGSAAAQSGGMPALAARNSDAAGVRVAVTAQAAAAGAKVWEFQVIMDTHTKPLTADLVGAATLTINGDKRYRPLAWRGDPPGGHHRKGALQFPLPGEQPKTVELQIAGIGGAAMRSFKWELD